MNLIWDESIDTRIEPELIKKILNDEYNFQCTICNTPINLDLNILIDCPEGKFLISTTDDIEINKKKLRKYNVIDKNDKLLKPIASDSINLALTKSSPDLSSDLDKLEKILKKDDKNS